MVTLEAGALDEGRPAELDRPTPRLPADVEMTIAALTHIASRLDVMLDSDHVPMVPVPEWPRQFERFAQFLADEPTGPEMRRRRTLVKFLADLGMELAVGAHEAGVTPENLSDWSMHHSEQDVSCMPSLGLYREVMHEKLCVSDLRWKRNDLVDMMFLTTATAYCDHVVGEKSHVSHIRSSLRRLGRPNNTFTNLRSLIEQLHGRSATTV